MIVHGVNGSSGCPWKNRGTTHPSILHKKCHSLWYLMDNGYHPPSITSPLKGTIKDQALEEKYNTKKRFSNY